MSGDFERFARLRVPLPQWWMRAEASADLRGEEGVCFSVRKGSLHWPCVVAYAVLEKMAGKKLQPHERDAIWSHHGDDIKGAAMRAIIRRDAKPGTTVRLALVDLLVAEE